MRAKLREGEWMQAQEVVPPLQGVAAERVEIETGAPPDENAALGAELVVHAFQEVAPPAVLVELVEDPEVGFW